MARITSPDKTTGQQHTAAEYNEFKASINALYDQYDNIQNSMSILSESINNLELALDQITSAITNINITLLEKADLVDGTVPLEQATPLYLSDVDFSGTGETEDNPVTII